MFKFNKASIYIFLFTFLQLCFCGVLNTQGNMNSDQIKAQEENLKGLQALAEGRWPEAENFFKLASELNPSSPEYPGNVGIALMNQGKGKESVVFFIKAIEIDPVYAKGYYNLGVCYQNLKDFKQSIRNYEKAVDLVPTMIEARFNLGLVYSFIGEKAKAKANYEEFIKLAPKVSYEKQIIDAKNKIKELE